jgi:putative thioredoxin
VSIHHLVVIDAWGATLPTGWADLLAQLQSAGEDRSTVAVLGVGEVVFTILPATPLSTAPPTLAMPPLIGPGPADTSYQLNEAVENAQVQLGGPEVFVHLLTDPQLDKQRLADFRNHPSIAEIRRADHDPGKAITAQQQLLADQLRSLGPDVPETMTTRGNLADSLRAGSGGPLTMEITEANFDEQVILRSDEVLVVVVLCSQRSGVCRQLLDTLSGLAAADNSPWSLATVDVDAAPRLAQIFGVDAVPTVVALAAGQPLSSFQGVQPADQLRRWLDTLLSATAGKLKGQTRFEDSPEVDLDVGHARQQLEAGDFAAAKESYRAILDADPNSVEAKVAIRQIEFLTRATAQRPDAVALADAAPGDIAAAFAAADVQILNQDVGAAFERLIALVRSTSGDERTWVRTRLIELFELFDPADREVVVGRHNLANALC